MKEEKTKPENKSKRSDADLLILMSWKSDIDTAQAAFAEFYANYANYLQSACTSVCGTYTKWYGSDLPSTVFNNTFTSVYEKPGLLIDAINNLSDPLQIMHKIEATLGKIASYELRANIIAAEERHRKLHPQLEPVKLEFVQNKMQMKPEDYQDDPEMDTDLEIELEDIMPNQENDENEDVTTLSVDRDMVIPLAKQLLNTRDYEILIACMEFEEPNKTLPRDVIQQICNRFGTTKENMRQIRCRALKKLQNYFANQKKESPISIEK